MAKPKQARKPKNVKQYKIDIDQILLSKRQLYLFGPIDEELAYEVIRRLMALDRLANAPIVLYIDSPGGCVSDGFAIIDTMKGINSPVVTFVIGRACSMAGIISIAGDQRVISKNADWMAHDMAGGIWGDYTTKVLARADYLKIEQKKIFDFIRKHSKLSESEINKAIHEELWLTPEECIKKGIVDVIVGEKE
jgi:ATP-dependent Clp protease protease subunit